MCTGRITPQRDAHALISETVSVFYYWREEVERCGKFIDLTIGGAHWIMGTFQAQVFPSRRDKAEGEIKDSKHKKDSICCCWFEDRGAARQGMPTGAKRSPTDSQLEKEASTLQLEGLNSGFWRSLPIGFQPANTLGPSRGQKGQPSLLGLQLSRTGGNGGMCQIFRYA